MSALMVTHMDVFRIHKTHRWNWQCLTCSIRSWIPPVSFPWVCLLASYSFDVGLPLQMFLQIPGWLPLQNINNPKWSLLPNLSLFCLVLILLSIFLFFGLLSISFLDITSPLSILVWEAQRAKQRSHHQLSASLCIVIPGQHNKKIQSGCKKWLLTAVPLMWHYLGIQYLATASLDQKYLVKWEKQCRAPFKETFAPILPPLLHLQEQPPQSVHSNSPL